jgi:hypothetical protein
MYDCLESIVFCTVDVILKHCDICCSIITENVTESVRKEYVLWCGLLLTDQKLLGYPSLNALHVNCILISAGHASRAHKPW